MLYVLIDQTQKRQVKQQKMTKLKKTKKVIIYDTPPIIDPVSGIVTPGILTLERHMYNFINKKCSISSKSNNYLYITDEQKREIIKNES